MAPAKHSVHGARGDRPGGADLDRWERAGVDASLAGRVLAAILAGVGRTRWSASWATVGGEVLASARVAWGLGGDQGTASVDVAVEPKFWRMGLGSHVFFETVIPMRRSGRVDQVACIVSRSSVKNTSTAEGFAASLGFREVQRDLAWSLDFEASRPHLELVSLSASSSRRSAYVFEHLDGMPDHATLCLLTSLVDGLHREMPIGMPSEESPWSTERLAHYFRYLEGSEAQVTTSLARVERSGELVGYSIAQYVERDRRCSQRDIYVRPDSRGHGIASAIQAAAYLHVARRWRSPLRIVVTTASTNRASNRVYSSMGFAPYASFGRMLLMGRQLDVAQLGKASVIVSALAPLSGTVA